MKAMLLLLDSDAAKSLREKLSKNGKPGAIVLLTKEEMEVLQKKSHWIDLE